MEKGLKRSGKRVSKTLLAFLFLAVILTPLTAQADNPNDILIVANKAVPVDEISIGDLRNIFLKKKTQWKMGIKAIPLHTSTDDTLRNAFRKKVLEMDSHQEKDYWKDARIMTATTEPPKFSNLLKAVYKLKNSVAYVYRKDYIKGVVKIILVLPAK